MRRRSVMSAQVPVRTGSRLRSFSRRQRRFGKRTTAPASSRSRRTGRSRSCRHPTSSNASLVWIIARRDCVRRGLRPAGILAPCHSAPTGGVRPSPSATALTPRFTWRTRRWRSVDDAGQAGVLGGRLEPGRKVDCGRGSAAQPPYTELPRASSLSQEEPGNPCSPVNPTIDIVAQWTPDGRALLLSHRGFTDGPPLGRDAGDRRPSPEASVDGRQRRRIASCNCHRSRRTGAGWPTSRTKAGERRCTCRATRHRPSRVQVSRDGGSRPIWTKRGDALYFVAGSAIMSSTVTTAAGAARRCSTGHCRRPAAGPKRCREQAVRRRARRPHPRHQGRRQHPLRSHRRRPELARRREGAQHGRAQVALIETIMARARGLILLAVPDGVRSRAGAGTADQRRRPAGARAAARRQAVVRRHGRHRRAGRCPARRDRQQPGLGTPDPRVDARRLSLHRLRSARLRAHGRRGRRECCSRCGGRRRGAAGTGARTVEAPPHRHRGRRHRRPRLRAVVPVTAAYAGRGQQHWRRAGPRLPRNGAPAASVAAVRGAAAGLPRARPVVSRGEPGGRGPLARARAREPGPWRCWHRRSR